MKKTLLLAVFIASITLVQTGRCNDKAGINAGMLFAEAKQILDRNRILQKEVYFDVIIPRNLASAYFALDNDFFLQLTYNKQTKRIISLSIMLVPSYRPVKGLEVYKELEMIEFDKDTYVVRIKKPKEGNPADTKGNAAE